MRSSVYGVGELVGVDEGYSSGIWLRSGRGEGGNVVEVGHVVGGDMMVVLEVDGDRVRVLSGGGGVGWTWMNRLRVLEG